MKNSGRSEVLLIVAVLGGLFFSSLDTAIVSTSLLTISSNLGDVRNSSWIVLAYLLTYMGCAVWISKLSDIYGRKNILLLSWTAFVAFSVGCAAASTMMSLILCRAFQGMGASGLYSLTHIALMEIGPVDKPSLIGAVVGITLAISFVLGPILGGIISELSSWRWLFNMNVPFGLVMIFLIASLWPPEIKEANPSTEKTSISKIDYVGGTSLIASSVLLVFALQQAGSGAMSWTNPVVLVALVMSVASFTIFFWKEQSLSKDPSTSVEPVMPAQLFTCRVYVSGLLVTVLTGFSYISLSILIPERAQILRRASVLAAGLNVLPLLGSCAVGSFLGGVLSRKRNNTSYTLIAASFLQLIGTGLLASVTQNESGRWAEGLSEAIFGLGVGLSFSGNTIMTSIMIRGPKQRASAQGGVAQARVLGGCLGLTACTIAYNSQVSRYFGNLLNEVEMQLVTRVLLDSSETEGKFFDLVRRVYFAAYDVDFQIMCLVAIPTVLISLLTLETRPTSLEHLTSMSPRSP